MLGVKLDLWSEVEIADGSRQENRDVGFNNTCIEAASANPGVPVWILRRSDGVCKWKL
jgi:hypothetical protein